MKLIPCSAFAPRLGGRSGDRGCRREFLRVSSLRSFISLISHLQSADDIGLFFGCRDLVQDAPCRGRAAGKRDDRSRSSRRFWRWLLEFSIPLPPRVLARVGAGVAFSSGSVLRVRLWSESTCASTIVLAIHSIARNCRPRRGAAAAVRQRSRILIETKIEIFWQLHLARARPLDHVGRRLPQLRLKFVRLKRRLWKHPRLQLVLQREQRNRDSCRSAPLSCADFLRLGTARSRAAGSIR